MNDGFAFWVMLAEELIDGMSEVERMGVGLQFNFGVDECRRLFSLCDADYLRVFVCA